MSPAVGRETVKRLMPIQNLRRRRIRLPAEAYAELGIFRSGRAPVFACPAVAAAAVDVLRRQAAATGVGVDAWCVMPDHVHLVIGASPTCDIVTFVGQFKNLAQREAWWRGIKGAFWQTRFWDHFLRGDERLEQVVEYVLNNPVRSGLVERWCDYRFSGCRAGACPPPTRLADVGGGQAPALRRALG